MKLKKFRLSADTLDRAIALLSTVGIVVLFCLPAVQL